MYRFELIELVRTHSLTSLLVHSLLLCSISRCQTSGNGRMTRLTGSVHTHGPLETCTRVNGIGICQKMLKAKKALWAKLGVPLHEDGIWLLGQQLHLTFLEAKIADILTDKELHVPEKIRELRNSFKETNAEMLQCEVTATNIQPALYAQWLEQQKDF